MAALAANGRETLADAAETVLGFQSIRPSVWDDASTSHLARELHDGVAGELSTMLLDLERFRAGQAGRQSALSEIAQLQEPESNPISSARSDVGWRAGTRSAPRSGSTFPHRATGRIKSPRTPR